MKKPILLLVISSLTLFSCGRHYQCSCKSKTPHLSGEYVTFGYDASSKKDAQEKCNAYATDTTLYDGCSL